MHLLNKNKCMLPPPLDTSQSPAIVARNLGVICSHLSSVVVSAGISHNKLLAKLASGMNKPNNQTVIPVSAVAGLMGGLALSKIRNFGGKLGHMLEALGCVTAADVQRLSHAQLEAAVGDNAAYASHPNVVSASDSPVVDTFMPSCFKCWHLHALLHTRLVCISPHGLKRVSMNRSDWCQSTAGL